MQCQTLNWYKADQKGFNVYIRSSLFLFVWGLSLVPTPYWSQVVKIVIKPHTFNLELENHSEDRSFVANLCQCVWSLMLSIKISHAPPTPFHTDIRTLWIAAERRQLARYNSFESKYFCRTQWVQKMDNKTVKDIGYPKSEANH